MVLEIKISIRAGPRHRPGERRLRTQKKIMVGGVHRNILLI